ncbi:MAG: HigA family addiction module antitoxin [Antarcticimicrobium sp.]|uniref:HigA family addiction module antitoxin n=1 Tax=Antarcticimicrobium sp. TaxID=2824147 RepID=UPI002615CB1D|nr:HigA family addiction module antitoxin [Antarcticimicrobium sp.]MDF1718681.1 HigA family addiction module antitoxin [Antarcticimicrobium sp.]
MSGKPGTAVQAADVQQVNDWLDRNEIVLVDVRETSEYEVEHIAGALLLPLSSFDPELFPTLPGKRLVLHCAVGKRSEAAGKMLLNEGHEGVTHMTGGLDAWKAAGFATEFQLTPPGEAEAAEGPVFLCPAPGEVLRTEYLEPLGITAQDLARSVNVLEGRITDVLAGKSSVGVELSLRLARYFSTAADFWVHLQLEHDMERARHSMGEQIRRDIVPRVSAG